MDADPWPGSQNLLFLTAGKTGLIDATARLPQIKSTTYAPAAGDIDGDHDIDIVVLNSYGGSPPTGDLTDSHVLVNDGTGQFSRDDTRLSDEIGDRSHGQFQAGFSLLFDANGDGAPDLFMGQYRSTAEYFTRILLNDGAGHFSLDDAITFPHSLVAKEVVEASTLDLNGDDAIDLLLVLHPLGGTGEVVALVNDGKGNFADESNTRISNMDGSPTRPQVIDFNGDGYDDFVLSATFQTLTNPIFLNDGTGHFVRLPTPLGAGGIIEATPFDANDDGRIDLLVQKFDSNKIVFDLMITKDQGKKVSGTKKADALLGDGGKEVISGLNGKDVIFAAKGNDKVFGGDANDYLNGGDGNDKMDGEAGSDTLVGGLGRDKLTGGSGKDIFKFNAVAESALGKQHDTITDFKGDRIDLTFIDANPIAAGNQAFIFIGNDSFSDYASAHPGVRGMARYDKGLLQADLNGNGVADFEVKIKGKVEADDLIL